MSPRLKLRHTPRYRQLVTLLVKHGRGDLIRSAGLDPDLPDEEVPGDPDAAASLAADLEAMGPTFVKLGQMMSTRVDLFSPAYIDALSRLQDDVAPFGYDEVESLVSSELGVRLASLFPRFDNDPAGRGVAGPGAPRDVARRARRRGEGAAAGHPPAGPRGHGGPARGRGADRRPHRARAPLRPRPAARGVPALLHGRAGLPTGGRQPHHHRRDARGQRPDRRPPSVRRLHHQPGADHGVRAGAEGDRHRSAGAARHRRRHARRRALPGLPAPRAGRRHLPRRPTSRQRARHRRRPARAARHRHGGADPARIPGEAAQAPAGPRGRPTRRRRPRRTHDG